MVDCLDIRYCKIYFKLRLLRNSELPEFKVSLIRGGVGEMLLQQYCLSDRECDKCGFIEDCPVPRLYYHPLKIKPKYVGKGESLGYAWGCEDRRTVFKSGDSITVELILFGNTIIYFSDILQAMYRLGMAGIGKNYVRFEVAEVLNEKNEPILYQDSVYNNRILVSSVQDYVNRQAAYAGDRYEIHFLTPFSAKMQGKWIQKFDGEALLTSIRRRIYMLNCMEGHAISMKQTDPGILPQTIAQNAEMQHVTRYSNTHKSKILLRGIVGGCTLEGVTEDVYRCLAAGQLIRVGKNTSMGFGKYSLCPI